MHKYTIIIYYLLVICWLNRLHICTINTTYTVMVGGHRITININLKQIALNGIYILKQINKMFGARAS